MAGGGPGTVRDEAWANIGTWVRHGCVNHYQRPAWRCRRQRVQYDLYIPNQQPVNGAFVTSHRSISGNYVPINTIPTVFGDSNHLFEQFTNPLRTRWAGGWTGRTPQMALKETLIAAAVFGGAGTSLWITTQRPQRSGPGFK